MQQVNWLAQAKLLISFPRVAFIRERLRYVLHSYFTFETKPQFDVQQSPVKCSTLTICWVGEGLKSPRGQTGVLLRVKENEEPNKLTRRKVKCSLILRIV